VTKLNWPRVRAWVALPYSIYGWFGLLALACFGALELASVENCPAPLGEPALPGEVRVPALGGRTCG
jgi:hypothetical protein